ncbi:AAA family ATPase [Runella salmonicolor]|uniref:ATP-binding protein n=1 Tax=Runella salmonicolor TaxID=2950278 RepID=A0ABT1FRT5_9BACT|nr:AAA family ATPase [Runella salmonicolor]MCP1384427.1 ATP-binding protein [Runella salmonicolor]
MKKFIINIVGPRATGKTTVIKELLEYLPQYEVLAIDDFRLKYGSNTPMKEFNAWMELSNRINECRYIILETSGTSQNLREVYQYLKFYYELEVFTVYLEAPLNERIRRQRDRKVRGYIEPIMYFERSIEEESRASVLPVQARIFNVNSAEECAGQIMDRLPDTMV